MNSVKRRKLRWLRAALNDLDEIVVFIAQDSQKAAEVFAETILAKVELLAESAYVGSICPYYRKSRQLVHGNYIIYYTVHRHEVVIRAVVHGAQLFRSEWLRRGE